MNGGDTVIDISYGKCEHFTDRFVFGGGLPLG